MPSEKLSFQPPIAEISQSFPIEPIFPILIKEFAMCPDCNENIPSHNTYRFNGIGIKMTKEEWKIYGNKKF